MDGRAQSESIGVILLTVVVIVVATLGGVVVLGGIGGEADSAVGSGDRETITAFFDIGDAELAVVDGDLEAVVLERVALLDVQK